MSINSELNTHYFIISVNDLQHFYETQFCLLKERIDSELPETSRQ